MRDTSGYEKFIYSSNSIVTYFRIERLYLVICKDRQEKLSDKWHGGTIRITEKSIITNFVYLFYILDQNYGRYYTNS